MSDASPTIDPIGYRCDGCGRLCRDPYADLSSIRAAGGRSCCPERKMVGLSERIEELEAKLAKAVEALVWCSIYEESEVATATIAELSSVSCANLKGENDEL